MSTPLTIGAVAERFGCKTWQVRRLFERGILPQAARVGAYRVIDPADLGKVEAALKEAGYPVREAGREELQNERTVSGATNAVTVP